MASPPLPSTLDHGRHVALERRGREPWVRRVVMTVLLAVSVAALAGAFGQSPKVQAIDTPAATLRVAAPDRVRGGLFFQGRFDITAHRRIGHPRLVLEQGWAEELQLNTIEPAPAGEATDDGRLQLEYGALEPGDHLTVWLQFEANPTGIGHRGQQVQLRDGSTVLATLDRSITVLP
jgi:hypothetical protein